MNYHQMVKELNNLGFSIYNFKENVVFRNLKEGIEFDVSRNLFPRKNASSEQCQFVLNKAMNLLNINEN